MKQKMKLPCNVIFLMALLPLSQRYKHLSWGFQHIPCGLVNFAWSPAPSAKLIDEPASVVISSVLYMSAWLLKHSNYIYLSGIFFHLLLVTYLQSNSRTPSAEVCPLLPLSFPWRGALVHQLPTFSQVEDLACHPAATQLRWWNNVNHLWPFLRM